MIARPANWPQQVRRGLPFPPGRDNDEFTIISTGDASVYHVNQRTCEAFLMCTEFCDAPPWHELPAIVQEVIVALSTTRDR